MSRLTRAHEELDYAEASYREMRRQVSDASLHAVDERLLGIRLARFVLEEHGLDTWYSSDGRHDQCRLDGEPYPCEIAKAVLDHWAPGDEP